jgi:uncharacterized protein (TIGR03437 family)
VSISGAACGLYSVSSTQINFVLPPGLSVGGTFPITINNNGVVFRGALLTVAGQPDIFTSTNGPAGGALVCNATNPPACTGEPFTVTTNNGQWHPGSYRSASLSDGRAQRSARFNYGHHWHTLINASSNAASDLPGTDLVTFTLPSTVDTGDLPIVITVNGGVSRGLEHRATHLE